MTPQPAARPGSKGAKGAPGPGLRDQVRREFGLYTAGELAARLDFGGPANPRARNLTGKAPVLALVEEGVLYPGFQFDEKRNRVLPAVKDIVRMARLAGWRDEDLVTWFFRPNPLLSGKRPVDFREDEERLLPAAEKDFDR
ncbi:hypothetical protein ITX31_04980 [Arthrobacter gandavensis]|uniref:hypothetical protein n=1 Tax=Arthrobacter gandavensis TaxID=169960 RepID=UPI00188FF713|nr:hypothetical protein [Arthrobacter gandavensis]MBF4993467.1 hypothetical protein [Arthrobacter gandavensis]